MHPVFILILALLFALAERFTGGDYVTNIRTVISTSIATWSPSAQLIIRALIGVRPVVWATVALAIGLELAGAFAPIPFHHGLGILALGFAGYRWDGWGTFGGGIDPHGSAQVLGLFERQLFAVPALAIAAWLLAWAFPPVLAVAAAMVVFSLYATTLGVVLALAEGELTALNGYIEFARGLGMGALVAVALTASF